MRYLALAPWVSITHELRAVAKDTHLEKVSNTLPSREGFTITEEALTSLVSNNGQLRNITLPGGCSWDQLQPLRRLTALRWMTLEAPTGDTTECLPENLEVLDIAGE